MQPVFQMKGRVVDRDRAIKSDHDTEMTCDVPISLTYTPMLLLLYSTAPRQSGMETATRV